MNTWVGCKCNSNGIYLNTPGIAQIPLRRLSPKLPVGEVVDTNHEIRGHKPSPHVEMFATKSVTNSLVSL